ncbi:MULTISPECIES: protein-tyrosine phosphatase family protein [unclassified Bradyrhizobium]|uniref:phosphatase domain-containing protein n=1 Tax=unclassified Bradyrhizobium TaxID=2631580 RepID=UPI0028F05079|nr:MULTISPECIES: protein-tyrosine phosphatase family protein [unclassified Bradyrhizobium]
MSRLHRIDLPTAGRLAIAARPRAEDWLAEDIAAWVGEGIAVVVSLLEPAEVHDLGLQREAALCQSHGMAFVSFPIPDRGLPESRSVALQLAHDLAARLTDGQTVLIHCRAGIGRSAVIAACVMIRLGIDGAEAFDRIAAARGVRVPDTEDQREWVRTFERKQIE